jgi:hypothetical protein
LIVSDFVRAVNWVYPEIKKERNQWVVVRFVGLGGKDQFAGQRLSDGCEK